MRDGNAERYLLPIQVEKTMVVSKGIFMYALFDYLSTLITLTKNKYIFFNISYISLIAI